MIELKLDAPFSIGDEVWVKTYEDVYTKIECPFCNGNVLRDTGLTKIGVYGKMDSPHKEPWIVKCGTCNGNGKIKAWTSRVYSYRRHKLVGVDDWNYTDYDYIVEIIDDNSPDNGYKHTVNGRNIFLDKPQMSEA